MGTEFEVTGIESDQDNYTPYPVRLVCSTKGGGGTEKLVVWGKNNQMANVERIRQAPITLHDSFSVEMVGSLRREPGVHNWYLSDPGRDASSDFLTNPRTFALPTRHLRRIASG